MLCGKKNAQGVTNLATSTRARAWFYGTLGAVFLRALPNLRYPIGRDAATYCVISRGLLHGQLLYRDLWDNKPPGIFYIYAPIVKIFGPVMWCVGVVDILWLLVISCCIFYFGRRYLGLAGAVLSVIFYAFRHCRQGYIHAAQPEDFLMLCVFAAWFLLCEGDPAPPHDPPAPSGPGGGHRSRLRVARLLVAGLVLGAAFWLKYNAVTFFPFLALAPFLDARELDRVPPRFRLAIPWADWLMRMVTAGAGLAFAVAAVLAAFMLSGAWPAMREVQFQVLPRYGAQSLHWNLRFLLFALDRTQEHMGAWWEVMPALAMLIAWRCRELSRIVPLGLLAVGGYAAAAVQGRFHPYYFETCYPLFAMFWAYVCVKTYQGFDYLQRIFGRRHWVLARGLLWVLFACLVFSLLPEESVRTVQQYRLAADWWRDPEESYKSYYWQLPLEKLGDQLRVVDYLKANSGPQDEVYVWGTAALINYLSGRQNPSRFVTNMGVMAAWTPESWRQELVRTLEAKRPRYIVVARHDVIATVTFTMMDSEEYLRIYPGLAGLLRSRYQPIVNYFDFEVYRLK